MMSFYDINMQICILYLLYSILEKIVNKNSAKDFDNFYNFYLKK